MANTKPIDKTNPKNVYCDHCKHYDKSPDNHMKWTCLCKTSKHFGKTRNYWNRCKCFNWK